MNNLFVILLLVSVVALFVGLVRPEVFKKIIKEPTRKKIGLYFGGAIILFFILVGATAPKTDTKQKEQITKEETVPTKTEETKQETTQLPKETPETPATPAVTYSEATSYQKSGKTWKLMVFSRKPTDEELKKAAIELHSKDKNSYYSLFDDKEKIDDFKNWDINYGKVRDKDGQAKLATDCIDISYCVDLVSKNQNAYPFPQEWADQHQLGMINEMFSDGSMKWQLSSSLGEKISDL